MHQVGVLLMSFVSSFMIIGVTFGEEVEPVSPVQPSHVAPTAEAADELMISLVVRVDGLPETFGSAQEQRWSATVIENDTDDSDYGLKSGQRLSLRMQVPNGSLGEPGALAQIVVRPIDAKAEVPLWEVIGLPEAIAKPSGFDEDLALPDPESFARNLADMLEGSSTEGRVPLRTTAEVQSESQVTEILGEAEQESVAQVSSETATPPTPAAQEPSLIEASPTAVADREETQVDQPVVDNAATAQPLAGPVLPPQPLKSRGLILGHHQHTLIEYTGPLRQGGAFAISLRDSDVTAEIQVLEVDGRFALVSGPIFQAGEQIELSQDAEE